MNAKCRAADLEAAAAAVQNVVERARRATADSRRCRRSSSARRRSRSSCSGARGSRSRCVEVGLGGRLDATNVVTPMAAAITSIDFDHQDLLGETLESIAREKAGVIKPGIPVVCGPVAPGARAVIEAICREQGARLVPAAERVRVTASRSDTIDDDTTVSLEAGDASPGGRQARPAGPPPGRQRGRGVQPDDASSSASACASIGRAMREGLTGARWPGRLERCAWRGADVLLDAAHNPAGARALAAYLREIALDWRDARLRRDARQGRRRHAVGPASLLLDARLHDAAEPARAARRGARGPRVATAVGPRAHRRHRRSRRRP